MLSLYNVGATLAGYADESASQIPQHEILLVEAVDNSVLAYTVIVVEN